jgi:hypothetical protein
MVFDSVWAQSGLGRYDGFLCLDCLARRLGRPLRLSDFNDAPVNEDHRDVIVTALREQRDAVLDAVVRR